MHAALRPDEVATLVGLLARVAGALNAEPTPLAAAPSLSSPKVEP